MQAALQAEEDRKGALLQEAFAAAEADAAAAAVAAAAAAAGGADAALRR
jgi:hypothetical protein